jgi:hypothetical protein
LEIFNNQWFWFFENLKAKQPPVPVSSEAFRSKEPTCDAEGYLISSEIFLRTVLTCEEEYY